MAGLGSKDSSPQTGSQKTSGTSALADLPEVAALKRRRRRILGTFAALVLVAGVSAKPVYAVVKRWRCTSLAQESTELLERGDVEQAFSRARAAHQLIPEEPEALRAVARVLTARNDWPNAMAFWAEVVKRAPSSADRREYAEAALRTGALPNAVEQAGVLLSDQAGVAENHLLAAKIHVAQRDLDRAIESAREAVTLDAADEAAAFLLSQILLQKADTRPEGVQRLEQLGAGTSAIALQALVTLSAIPELPDEKLLELATALRSHPKADDAHRLKAVELEIRNAPDKRAERLDAVQAEYAAAEPERLRTFAMWLSLQGEHARALQVLPGERAFARKDLFLVRLDAMAALAQWREILDVLKQDRVPLEPALASLFKARCWKEVGEPEQADIAWRSALVAASNDLNTLLYVAGYAEKTGVNEQAERAYRTLTQNPKTARIAYEALLRLTPQTDTAKLRDLLAEMAQRWPKDVALANDLAYLNTLLNIDVPQNRAKAQQLVETAPESLPHRTVLALAELRGGNTEAALQVYQGLHIDWRTAAPGAVVVYASALRHAGRAEEAKALVAALTADALRPEEKVLLAAIQKP